MLNSTQIYFKNPNQINLLLLDLVNSLSNKKIFLTGGTGFFGQNIISAIQKINEELEKPIRVTVLTRKLSNYKFSPDSNIDLVEGDIYSKISLKNDFDFLINAAVPTYTELNSNPDKDLIKQIILSTNNIIEWANLNPSIKVLHTSSGAVYTGLKEKIYFEENYADLKIYPNMTAYAIGKIESEKLFHDIANFHFTIARCFAFTGSFLPLEHSFAVGNFIRDIINKQDIIIKGNGLSQRSYLHTSDLVLWLLTLLSKAKANSTYNLGSDQAITIKDLAELTVKICKSKSQIKILNEEKNQSIYIPSIDKARKDFSLDVFNDLETSIFKTYQYYQ